MKQGILFGLVAAVALYAGVTLIAVPKNAEWTTRSHDALVELEAALEAETKLYKPEARWHLERALELDPGFVMAKLQLLEQLSDDERELQEQLIEEIRTTDLGLLTPRERFLAERTALWDDGRFEEIEAHLAAYLELYPDDPWVLFVKATTLRNRGEAEQAALSYQHLIEVAPNWVGGYNQLGYIRMQQGRFDEAEEYFTAYRFIAPDQANPHDSLGELFIILGRLDEAVQSLETALETKADFWNSYDHLALAHALRGDQEGMLSIIDRASENVPTLVTRMKCSARTLELATARQWHRLVEETNEDGVCGQKLTDSSMVFAHLGACRMKDWKTAKSYEARLRSAAESVELPMDRDPALALAETAEGIRLGFQGDFSRAIARFEAADARLRYIGCRIAVHKHFNRLLQVEALLAAGREAQAYKLLGEVESVNPTLVDGFRQRNLMLVGFVKRPDRLGWS